MCFQQNNADRKILWELKQPYSHGKLGNIKSLEWTREFQVTHTIYFFGTSSVEGKVFSLSEIQSGSEKQYQLTSETRNRDKQMLCGGNVLELYQFAFISRAILQLILLQ